MVDKQLVAQDGKVALGTCGGKSYIVWFI